MKTCHIHIKGRVQGVGFRPYIYQTANKLSLQGWVNNSADGVHIEVTGEEEIIASFYKRVTENPPRLSLISSISKKFIPTTYYPAFTIRESYRSGKVDLLLTPDFALCDDCRNEVKNTTDRRYNYAFITCTNCGPRYSITTRLPYDRPYTTMSPFRMCSSCEEEYYDPENRRHYSQTNSCNECGIELKLYDSGNNILAKDTKKIINLITGFLNEGKVIAVKGIGGYLLMADASNPETVNVLRKRKERPFKPFAVMYPSLDRLSQDVILSNQIIDILKSPESPIALATLKANASIAKNVAPDNPYLGVMLPYTPLFELILDNYGGPVIATSGNISGSPIIYEDHKALSHLSAFADYILTNNRRIVVPQDDSVVRFSESGEKITLRRSRGYAPSFLSELPEIRENVLAVGGELKSTFGIKYKDRLYISQFLGNMSSYDTQISYELTLKHLSALMNFKPDVVLTDQHPGYFTSKLGNGISNKLKIPLKRIQHHKAHFAAVLAENDMLFTNESVMGFIWDGTGWGTNGEIWGSETFIKEGVDISRKGHIDSYLNLLGDKMANEPRLSALSLIPDNNRELLKEKFTGQEWTFYSRLLDKNEGIPTTSMGRLFDAVASILDLKDYNSFEGEAAMSLEFAGMAGKKASVDPDIEYYPIESEEIFPVRQLISFILSDKLNGISNDLIAFRFHQTLVRYMEEMAVKNEIHHVAFSGGVFQNALLVDLIKERFEGYNLLFHKQLSPNDECISYGQLAYYSLMTSQANISIENKELYA